MKDKTKDFNKKVMYLLVNEVNYQRLDQEEDLVV